MIKRSLGTKNVAEAKRRAHPIAIRTEAEFEAARERRSAPPRDELSENERAHLVAAYLHQRLADDEAARIEEELHDALTAIRARVLAVRTATAFRSKCSRKS